jgi:hypothetical protein
MHRRTLLRLGLASSAVLLLGGGVLALLEPGLRAGRLTSSGRMVMGAVGRAVLDGSLPTQAASQQAAIGGLLARLDDLADALPAHAQAELSQLLALLASAPGRSALAGLATGWEQASVAEIQQALQGMRVSGVSLRQQAYQALHDMVGGAYFADPGTWPLLGYPGPVSMGGKP